MMGSPPQIFVLMGSVWVFYGRLWSVGNGLWFLVCIYLWVEQSGELSYIFDLEFGQTNDFLSMPSYNQENLWLN